MVRQEERKGRRFLKLWLIFLLVNVVAFFSLLYSNFTGRLTPFSEALVNFFSSLIFWGIFLVSTLIPAFLPALISRLLWKRSQAWLWIAVVAFYFLYFLAIDFLLTPI